MPLYFDLTQPTGAVARIELKPGLQRLRVTPGDRYRIVDERGEVPAGLLVRRYENHLLIDDASATVKVELSDYYGRCGVSSPCILEVGEAGGQPVEVTPATEPIRALTDGSFVLYQGGAAETAAGTAAAPTAGAGDGPSAGWIIGGVVGGLAVAGLAAGGGGGSSGTSVSASPPVPAPSPSPAPAPGAPSPVDTTPPSQPQLTSPKEATTTRPLLTGTAEPGVTVRLVFDTDRDGRAEATYDTATGADGQWQLDLASARPVAGSLPASGLPDSARTSVTVVAIDASANVSPAQSFDLAVSTRSPEAPRITAVGDDAGARVGDIASGAGTDDLTPTLRGTLAEALPAGGRLIILRNGTEIAAQPAVSGLAWQVTDGGLALGQGYVYQARIVDALGVASPPSNDWQIQTRADPVGSARIDAITDNVQRLVGPVADGGITNDRTPTITGTLSQPLAGGETLQVLRDGVATALRPTITGTTFAVTDTLAADGRFTYAVRIVTPAGAGAASAGHTIVVDTVNSKTASITAVVDDRLPGTGTVRDGGSTDDTTPSLRGTVAGGLAPGETLEILRDDRVVGEIRGSGAAAWEFTDAGLGAERYTYNVRVVDAAGNIGRASDDYDIRVALSGRDVDSLGTDGLADATAPSAPVVAPAIALASLLEGDGAAPAPTVTSASSTEALIAPGPGIDRLIETSSA